MLYLHSSLLSCSQKMIYIYIYIYINTYINTYIWLKEHAYIHTYIHIYIHTYIHIYIHTYIHKHTHTGVGRKSAQYCSLCVTPETCPCYSFVRLERTVLVYMCVFVCVRIMLVYMCVFVCVRTVQESSGRSRTFRVVHWPFKNVQKTLAPIALGAHLNVCIHTYIHAYIHACMHTYRAHRNACALLQRCVSNRNNRGLHTFTRGITYMCWIYVCKRYTCVGYVSE